MSLLYKIGDLVATGGCAGKIIEITEDRVVVAGRWYDFTPDQYYEDWSCEYDRKAFDKLNWTNYDQIDAENLEPDSSYRSDSI